MLQEKEDNIDNIDELFDPEADDDDENWVDEKRKETEVEGKKCKKSDAVLNCPCCFTLLCLDCQRHEFYRTQYRAMFVHNCQIDWFNLMEYKEKKSKNPSKSPSDRYYPVKCKICATHVGVYDNEEIYHFFNILASHS